MSGESTDPDRQAPEAVEPPIGWDGRDLREMLERSRRRFDETGHYQGMADLELKSDEPFRYEQIYSRLRGALVNARETALNISASAIVREIGELCFQVYTPEGDCIALSTGIIVHVHTGSLAIKFMIEEGYEHDRGIRPGDIFCNNDNDIGNVHTPDIHTIVPIFHDGELVAWVDGVTHEPDIGGLSPGGGQIAPTTRFDDGFYVTCEKIGEDDRVYQDWKERAKRGVRTPMYWDLDEKCRLAGCHMIRDTIHDLIDDIGVDEFKQFSREVVEEGRRILHERVRERLFPGTYRDASFMPLPLKDEAWKAEARKDTLNHLPVEVTVQEDGGLAIDLTGASPEGPHPFNAAEGSMTGGLWVTLTQCLLHDGKVNDGSHFGIETEFPSGSVVNVEDPLRSTSSAWGSITPTFNAFLRNVSRGFFARGFREEVIAGYGHSADAYYGEGRLTDSDEHYLVANFEHTCAGLGASAVRDGLDWGYAMFNPESDMGDVEEWELGAKGFPYLSRRVKPNTAGHGKYRGGAGWEGVRTPVGSEDFSVYKFLHGGVVYTTRGLAGGYPSPTGYSVRVHDTDLGERFDDRRPFPVVDSPPGSLEEDIDGDVTRLERGTYYPTQLENEDLFHFHIQGGPGFGDPLERPVAKVKEDVEDGIFTTDIVEQVYGVVGEVGEENEFVVNDAETEQQREAILDRRRAESVPVEEFRAVERERITDGDLDDPVREMYRDVFDQSDAWWETFRDYWDLAAGFDLPDPSGDEE